MTSPYLDRKPYTERVRCLNDQFRQSVSGGLVVMTQGIAALEEDVRLAILDAVRKFDNFSADNDPWSEHDFGAFQMRGQSVFWKIDYYGHNLEASSPNPADPELTTRVMTIMLAEEY